MSEPIAIVGVGLRLPPDIATPDDAWSAFRDGVDGVSDLYTLPDGDRVSGARTMGGMLNDVAGFDAEFFNIPAVEAARMDPQQRLILQVAWEALEDAGLPAQRAAERTTGVYLGVYNNDYLTLQLKSPDTIDAYTAPGNSHSIIANRLSYLLNLTGPSVAVDTACSSSLTATHLAIQALRNGECDLAIVGGVNVIAAEESTVMTGKVLPMSSSGRCRSFDADADGIVRGEGAVAVVLERSGSATEAGRRARSLIRGSAINQDGRTNGLTAPNPRAQRAVIDMALANAKADPSDVVYIEAHGTGTDLGDPIEMDSLVDVYGSGPSRCYIGSAKAQMGHLEAAAGLTGLIRAAMALSNAEAPRQVRFDRLNPEISLDGTRLVIPREVAELPEGLRPRLAAVSSFGFGGSNAHIVLQEPTEVEPPPRPDVNGPLLLAFSARSRWSLDRLTESYRELFTAVGKDRGADVCDAAVLKRDHHRYRRAVAGGSPAEIARKLSDLDMTPSVEGPVRLVFAFSGQGVQWPGMTEGLDTDRYFASEFDTCDELVQTAAGWSLREALTSANPDLLARTDVAQLAIATVQLGIVRRLSAYGLSPHAVVGHSMGELVAACVAGALTRAELIDAVLARADLAQRCRGGRMASIGLPVDAVRALLAGIDRDAIDVAAINSPISTVVSGRADAVQELIAIAEADGVRTRLLPVDYGFHSPLLDGCDVELADRLKHVPEREPQIPFFSTVTGHRRDEPLSAEYWGANLRKPVRFDDALAEAIQEESSPIVVEIGPHPALLGDVQRIADAQGRRDVRVLPTLRRDRDPRLSLEENLAALYEHGCAIDWSLRETRRGGDVTLPLYPWRIQHFWAGAPHEPASSDVSSATEPTRPPTVAALSEAIRSLVALALGFDDITQVPVDTPLRDWGLESLQVVDLRNRIERAFAVTIPLDVLLAGESPESVATALVGQEAHTTPGISRDEAEKVLENLENLSQDDVEAMIAALAHEEQQ